MKQAYNMHPPTATLREINISQTQVKSPEATKSIFHRQVVIKSLDSAPPVSEAAGGSAEAGGVARCHRKLYIRVDLGPCTNLKGRGKSWLTIAVCVCVCVELFHSRLPNWWPCPFGMTPRRIEGQWVRACARAGSLRSSCQGSFTGDRINTRTGSSCFRSNGG